MGLHELGPMLEHYGVQVSVSEDPSDGDPDKIRLEQDGDLVELPRSLLISLATNAGYAAAETSGQYVFDKELPVPRGKHD